MTATSAVRNRGEQTKQLLIGAALEVFGECGLQAATTREIARRAGQNIAAITYHFQSKEGLYLAVAEWIADFIRQYTRPLATEVEQFLQLPAGQQTPEQTMHYMRRCLMTLSQLMTNPETLSLSQFMFREQLSPTAAYPLIHEKTIAPLHQLLTRLLAGYIGMDEDDCRAVIHTHALLGEALAFRMAKETIQLRAGWQQIGKEESMLIQQVLAEHLEILLNGLRDMHRARPEDHTL